MNERIRELAEQAETKEVGYYFFDREKFAELIIKECLEVCNRQANHYYETNNRAATCVADVLGRIIQMHFGIE